jgi:hypothetical protein
VYKVKLIGDEDDPCGIAIKPPDALGPRVPVFPAGGQKIVNKRGLFGVVRAGVACGFMQADEDSIGVIQRLAVNTDFAEVAGRDPAGAVFFRRTFDKNPPFLQE